MIDSIGGASATQASYAMRAIGNSDAQASTAPASAIATQEAAQDTAPEATRSAESAAAAHLGDQLNAQADAARVQRAVDDSATATSDTDATAQTQASAAAAGGPAPAAAGGAPAASTTVDADYIEEADTNSDKTVSDQERAVYDAKQRQLAEEAAATAKDPSATSAATDARSAEVRAAYGPDDNPASAFEVTA
jgi:hypothetical protein